MKNQWLKFFSGSVEVRITGKGVERFINECVRSDILVWDVKKQGTHSLTFFIHLNDIKKIRPIVRESSCKLKFVSKKGIPFLLKKTLLNSGFLIGTILFFSLIIVCSNMVWGIEIDGAKPETEHIIKKELKKMGIEKGKMQFALEEVESIQRNLTNNIDEITWVGVELKGTIFHFQVVEKNQPEPPEYLSPQNIVAKKNAVVTDIFVEEGQSLIKINDYVKKGQILVSGEIGKEDNKQLVPARGKIFGETWYKSTVVVELSTKFNVFTGDNKTKHFLQIGSLSIPVWGFSKNEYKNFENEERENQVKFFKWNLPLSYKKVITREMEETERKYSVEKAKDVAKMIGKRKLEDKLDDDATIIGEKVLQQTSNNGKVELEIYYNVIENIVTTKPLVKVQGD